MLTHEPRERVTCKTCSAKLLQSSLRTHAQVCNVGERVTCDVIVDERGDVVEAGATLVGQVVRDVAGVEQTGWKVCGQSSKNALALSAHKRDVHNREFKAVTCSKCTHTLTSAHGWRDHPCNQPR